MLCRTLSISSILSYIYIPYLHLTSLSHHGIFTNIHFPWWFKVSRIDFFDDTSSNAVSSDKMPHRKILLSSFPVILVWLILIFILVHFFLNPSHQIIFLLHCLFLILSSSSIGYSLTLSINSYQNESYASSTPSVNQHNLPDVVISGFITEASSLGFLPTEQLSIEPNTYRIFCRSRTTSTRSSQS